MSVKTHNHVVTDRELRVLTTAEQISGRRINEEAKGFMAACIDANFPLNLAAGATSSLLMTIATKAMMAGTGAPASVMIHEEVEEIATELQRTVAKLIAEWVEKCHRRDAESN